MIRSTLERVLQWLGIALPTFWSLHSQLCHQKKKKKNCAQMDFCARCLGSCLRAFLLVRSISLTEHLTGAACRHPLWGQFYLANGNPLKLTLVRWNHHRHGELRTVQTSTLKIWMIERPLFETWWEEMMSGSQIWNPNVSVSFKDEVNTGGTVFGSVESKQRWFEVLIPWRAEAFQCLRVVWVGFLWALQLPATVTHLWGERAVFFTSGVNCCFFHSSRLYTASVVVGYRPLPRPSFG